MFHVFSFQNGFPKLKQAKCHKICLVKWLITHLRSAHYFLPGELTHVRCKLPRDMVGEDLSGTHKRSGGGIDAA